MDKVRTLSLTAPGVGFEPTANALTAHCSTAELPRNRVPKVLNKRKKNNQKLQRRQFTESTSPGQGQNLVIAELCNTKVLFDLLNRLGFDLTDAFARHAELLPDLLKRVRNTVF